jgi:formamidopyrimidine-DNA glycosylase
LYPNPYIMKGTAIMPELPEVEIIRRQLHGELRGARIARCEVLLPRLVTHPTPRTYERALAGSNIRGVGRRGKYLLIDLDDHLELIIHLGMTGSLSLVSSGEERPRHTHLVFHIADGRSLLYVDPRTFGETALVPPGDHRFLRGLHTIGPEPIEEGFTCDVLAGALVGSARIKSALLDQSRVAGIGNIYADEMLYRAGIHPCRRLDDITPSEIELLHTSICEVLNEAISNGGSSIRDYVDLGGEPGTFQSMHRVYRREGEACLVCGEPIRRIRVSGRSSYYCPHCQR